ncbi:MAG: FAD-dependent oxidoreductase [Candidatus Diapherotrites archaeon]
MHGNFGEVEEGWSRQQVIDEGNRCLQCPKPLCVEGCPAKIDIKEFILKAREGDFQGALETIREKNYLPSFCGRVCDFEKQCEGACILAKAGNEIKIGKIERFLGDLEESKGERKKRIGKKVAVVGSGPAGISAALELSLNGVDVKLFEEMEDFGGIPQYAIPEFRLPKKVVEKEEKKVKTAGIEVETNKKLGKDLKLSELTKNFDAIILAIGGGPSGKLDYVGAELDGVRVANSFLKRANKGEDIPLGEKTVVIGGGNVAIDAARTASRLGSKTIIAYRRTEKEMPAIVSEIAHAKEDGVEFSFLLSPKRFEGAGKLEKVVFDGMELGGEDAKGRRKPVPTGNEEAIECSSCIVAIGQRAEEELLNGEGLALNEWGNIKVDGNFRTNLENVYSVGDSVTGPKTVIEAGRDGKILGKKLLESFK